MFKNILGYMGDRQLTYPTELAHELLENGLKRAALRDEIYCQLVKQVHREGERETECEIRYTLYCMVYIVVGNKPHNKRYFLFSHTHCSPLTVISSRLIPITHSLLPGYQQPLPREL